MSEHDKPAFSISTDLSLHEGLSKYEYIAAQVLKGYCANASYNAMSEKDLAKKACSQANELFKQLEKK